MASSFFLHRQDLLCPTLDEDWNKGGNRSILVGYRYFTGNLPDPIMADEASQILPYRINELIIRELSGNELLPDIDF